MPLLEWDKTGERQYEGGISHAVLYPPGQPGVAWNGLTSVNHSDDGGAMETFYLDGVPYHHHVQNSDFRATISAYTYPEEFEAFQGIGEIADGWYADDQPAGRFGLSYRTRVGNDINGFQNAYKLHLLYDLTAKPTDMSYNTLSDSDVPSTMSWDVKGIPQAVSGIRPTPHFILDSRVVPKYDMEAIEDILHGSPSRVSSLPPITDLRTYIATKPKITITDNGDGSWTAEGPRELVYMLDDASFQIDEVNATYSDPDTFTVSTTM